MPVLVVQMLTVEGSPSPRQASGQHEPAQTVLGVSIVFTAVFAPCTLWMLRGRVAGVPAELEDAAIVVGRVTSRVYAFLQSTPELTLPICRRTFSGRASPWRPTGAG